MVKKINHVCSFCHCFSGYLKNAVKLDLWRNWFAGIFDDANVGGKDLQVLPVEEVKDRRYY